VGKRIVGKYGIPGLFHDNPFIAPLFLRKNTNGRKHGLDAKLGSFVFPG
jgi:hypothetical protein